MRAEFNETGPADYRFLNRISVSTGRIWRPDRLRRPHSRGCMEFCDDDDDDEDDDDDSDDNSLAVILGVVIARSSSRGYRHCVVMKRRKPEQPFGRAEAPRW